MHYIQKNNLFSARLPGISANSNENYRRYNFGLLLILPEISGNIKFTTLTVVLHISMKITRHMRGLITLMPKLAVNEYCTLRVSKISMRVASV